MSGGATTRRARAALLAAGVACLALAWWLAPGDPARSSTPLARLLGPLARPAAAVQWARADAALRDGDVALGLSRARTAVSLDPASTEVHEALVRVLGWSLASPEREPDPEVRRAWLEAAVEAARYGIARAREPERLALLAALLLRAHADHDPPTAWPGGVDGLRADADAWFAQAEALGHPIAGELRARTRPAEGPERR